MHYNTSDQIKYTVYLIVCFYITAMLRLHNFSFVPAFCCALVISSLLQVKTIQECHLKHIYLLYETQKYSIFLQNTKMHQCELTGTFLGCLVPEVTAANGTHVSQKMQNETGTNRNKYKKQISTHCYVIMYSSCF